MAFLYPKSGNGVDCQKNSIKTVSYEPLAYLGKARFGSFCILYSGPEERMKAEKRALERQHIQEQITANRNHLKELIKAGDTGAANLQRSAIELLEWRLSRDGDLPYISPVRQRPYRISELQAAITHWQDRGAKDQELDVWITQNFFNPKDQNRRSENLLGLTTCFVDLDYYKRPELAACDPGRVAAMVQDHCRDNNIPRPSTIINSGRGLQVKWVLSSVLPKKAVLRWQAIQAALVDTFRKFEADSQAKDASRVLRLVGTYNSRSGQPVSVIGGTGQDVNFEDLHVSLLADRAATVAANKQKHVRRKTAWLKTKLKQLQREQAAENAPQLQLIKGTGGAINQTSLWSQAQGKILDLKRLAQLRKWDQVGVEEGYRHFFLLVLLSNLALAGEVRPENFDAKLDELRKDYAPNAINDFSALRQKVIDHYAGRKIAYRGRLMTPIYTYKVQTIINTLHITAKEQTRLKWLCDTPSPETKAAAQAEASRNYRQRNGAAPITEHRQRVSQERTQRRDSALAYQSAGLDVQAISELLGVSTRTVYTYLKEGAKAQQLQESAPVKSPVIPTVSGEASPVVYGGFESTKGAGYGVTLPLFSPLAVKARDG